MVSIQWYRDHKSPVPIDLDVQHKWAWVLEWLIAIGFVLLPVSNLAILATVGDDSALGTNLQASLDIIISLSTTGTLAMSYIEVPRRTIVWVTLNCNLKLNKCRTSEVRVSQNPSVLGRNWTLLVFISKDIHLLSWDRSTQTHCKGTFTCKALATTSRSVSD